MNRKTIPFRLILQFFLPTIPESIPEKRPKTVKESELRLFWNQNPALLQRLTIRRALGCEKFMPVAVA